MAKQAVVEEEERDYSVYADKSPTPTMVAFADWLIDEVGLTFANKAAEAKFRQGVQLGGTLRMEFQASESWKSDDRNPRSPQNQNGKATKPAARGKAKAQTEPETDDETEDEAPVKTTRRAPARGKAAAGTKATTRGKAAAATTGRRTGRRGAGAAASNDAEAPY